MGANTFVILHLTDLHYDLSRKRDIEIVKDALFSDLATLRNDGIIPDIVIFSGDFIFAGDNGYSDKRSDYTFVKDLFLDPLLNLLSLTYDNLYICPGNHDIQRAAVDEIQEKGLQATLTSRDEVNKFIDDIEKRPWTLDRLKNYQKFKDSISNKHLRQEHGLFSTYCCEKLNKKIGIACFNTAWRAYGGEADYGNLLLGERTVDKCIDDLDDCDLRIAVAHHPFEYLQAFERNELRRRVFASFHLWLQGHTHDPDFNKVQSFQSDSGILVTGGALYQSRDYYNGYSIIKYDLFSKAGEVHLREYIDRSRKFARANAYEDGVITFELSEVQNPISHRDLSVLSQIRNETTENVNKALLTFAATQTNAPKNLEELFVAPPISTESEETYLSRDPADRKQREDSFINLDDVINSNENYVFVGKSESGKTTLLNYILTKFLNVDELKSILIPNFVDCKLLPKGRNPIKRSLLANLPDSLVGYNLDSSLDAGNCLILLDDFDPKNSKHLKSLAEFAQLFPKNRFILTISQGTTLIPETDSIPTLNISHKTLYIHSFGRVQIRALTHNWFSNVLPETQITELAETLMRNLVDINIPKTPLIISLLLLVIEQQADFIPINKASLLERFIEILLEKSMPSGVSKGGIDYRNKEHFLSYVAAYMVHSQNYRLRKQKFEGLTSEYFEHRGLTIIGGISPFIRDLIERGVLMEGGDEIFFRFSCFCEFFIAKYMIEDRAFLNDIMTEEKYLSFLNEIDYMTGLQRNNRDILDLLNQRVETTLNCYLADIEDRIISLSHFDKFTLEGNLLDSIEGEDREQLEIYLAPILQRVEGDETPVRLPDVIKQGDGEIVARREYDDFRSDVLSNLIIFSTVVKNCELIDDRYYKMKMVDLSLQSFAKITYLSCLAVDSMFATVTDPTEFSRWSTLLPELPEDVSLEDRISMLRIFLKSLMLPFSQMVIFDCLGTPKLQGVIEEGIDNVDSPSIIRLLNLTLYLSLRLPKAIVKAEKFLKLYRKNRYYSHVIESHLFRCYAQKQLYSPDDVNRMENLLADLIIGKSRQSQVKASQTKSFNKSRIIASLRNMDWEGLFN